MAKNRKSSSKKLSTQQKTSHSISGQAGDIGDQGNQQRLISGIPRLDYILKGGLIRGGIYAVFGPPGGGKTIFANHLCFNYIKNNKNNAIYLTLLTESHSKMLQHMRAMEFFDPTCVDKKLFFLSGYQTLKQEGIKGLLALMRSSIRQHKADLIVVDGLESIEHFSKDKLEYKEFLHELQAFTAMAECTSLLLATSHMEEARRPENTLVDGVIQISDQLIGPRAVRELTVLKFRGSDYLRGRHEMEITKEGLQIHPRTEIQFDRPPEEATESRLRMGFGVKSLDKMLGGGIPSGSTTALLGAPGAGKTTLGLNFLVEGARRGQKGIYFGFYEPPPRLIEKAGLLGLELKKYVDSGMIELIWQPPLEHYMDSLAEQLLEKIRSKHLKRRRLFIDGVEGFRAAAVYGDRMPRFLSALTNQLRMLDVTTIMTEELALFRSEVDMPNPELANTVESVILLRYVELKSQLYRLISVMKMRESQYDTSIREFKITDNGIEVASSFESADRILTGQPQMRNSKENG